MNLVVREGDVVLVYRIPARSSARSIAHCPSHEGYQVKENAPLLELDLPVIGTGLGSDESLEVADGVVGAALHTHYFGRCAPSKCGSSRERSECVPLRPRRSLAITCIHRNHVHTFDEACSGGTMQRDCSVNTYYTSIHKDAYFNERHRPIDTNVSSG